MTTTASVLINRLLAKGRFRHLQVLARVAELGSVRRAAASIGMTQPAVTQLLADLEALLDVKLFDRHSRGVSPTPACQALLPLVRQSLSGIAATAEAVADRHDAGHGVVRVWGSTAGVNGLLVHAIPAFNERHPTIQVHVREAELADQWQGIARDEVDLGICRQSATTPAGWRFEALLPDEFVVVGSPGHPLAHRRPLSWASLAGETWVMPPIDSAARRTLDAMLARHGLSPPRCQVITRVSAMTWALLAAPRHLTLVPASVFRQLEDAGRVVRLVLDQAMPFEPLGMLLPEDGASPATLRLAAFLRETGR